MSENENIKMWKKIASGVITGAILMMLTAGGQLYYMSFIVKENTKDIEYLKDVNKEQLKTKYFMKYVELAEERNKYLKEGVEENSENLKILQSKIDRELSKIRDAMGYNYRTTERQ